MTLLSDINADKDPQSDLVKLAYMVAIKPHLHHVLADAIDRQLEAHIEAPVDGSQPDPFAGVLEHFEAAHDLLDRRGRKQNTGAGSLRVLETDPQPGLLLDPSGRIVAVNPAGAERHGWKAGERFVPSRDTSGPPLSESLSLLPASALDATICIVKVEDADPDSLAEHRYVLTRTEDADGEPLGRLSAVSLTWLPDIAFQFQESFGLSPAELRVTQAIVTGQGLNALAQERGRAIGTLRNQLKSVLRKLGLSSQTELACLYSGYLRLARHESRGDYGHSFRNTPWRRHDLFTAPDGGTIDYNEIGRPGARPVLFFHPVILGTALAEPVRRAAEVARVRVISPLRPGFGKSSIDPSADGELDRFAARLKAMLDDQGIDRIQVMAENTGFIAASYTCALLGDRALGLVGVSPAVPLTERAFFKTMSRQQRNLYYIARYAPRLMPMIIRSIVAKCDSGFDEEWITEHFQDSPLDLELMEREEFKRAAREAYAVNYAVGVEGVTREFNATGRDWTPVLDRITCPITLTTGFASGQFGPDVLRKVAETRPNMRVEIIERAAYFVLHQRPDEVFRLLTEQFEAAA